MLERITSFFELAAYTVDMFALILLVLGFAREAWERPFIARADILIALKKGGQRHRNR